jgi:signal transduction histidine kinase/ActR/RegA family two-component response regulator
MSGAPAELKATRERLLRILLYGLAAMGLPAWVMHVHAILQLGMIPNLIVSSIGYWALVVCALLPSRVPFGLRAAALEIVLFGLAVDSLLRFGLSGAGPAILISVAVLATVLFGLRSGLIFGAICMASMGLVGAGYVTGLLELDPTVPATLSGAQAWTSVTAILTVFCVVLVLAPGMLQRDLLRTLEERESGALALVEEAMTRAKLQSEKQQLAEQLHQAQKMEAVGQLAGGVAHDFNNVLTAIRGNMELALGSLEPDSRAAQRIETSLHSVDRAAELSGRLLAFSRRKVMAVNPTSVHACLRSLAPMLQRLIGEDIRLEIRPKASQDVVMADVSQLELVMMNLALNARDAMQGGGLLRLSTSNEPPPPATDTSLILEVTDTGHGMDAETQARIFEPFFTTKGVGRGTGLGLTMVFNIIQQHGGEIRVSSSLGQGTRIAFQLPCVTAQPSTAHRTRQPSSAPRGSERVLLVEDDPMVLETTEAMLEELGYRVDSATNPDEALAYARRAEPAPDLLLTDVVLPGMNGRELAEQLLAIHPRLRVVFTSGYTEDDVLRRGVASEKVHFLPKPFSPSRLATILREALAAHSGDIPDIADEIPRGKRQG